jgi:hypothetical protein
MKISFKPVIDHSEQLNLRISPLLKQRIERLKTRGKILGLDFAATIVAYLEELVADSEAQMNALEQPPSKSVTEQSPANVDVAKKSLATSVTHHGPITEGGDHSGQ